MTQYVKKIKKRLDNALIIIYNTVGYNALACVSACKKAEYIVARTAI